MDNKRIGLRDIRAIGLGETIWDGAVAGFGARRQESGAVSYVLKYRTAEGRQRWLTIGRHGSPWTPDTAREHAKGLLGTVSKGGDPAADKLSKRSAATVAELCDQYMADAKAGRLLTRRKLSKRPSTLTTDAGRIECHIKPLLGRMAVSAMTGADIDKFMHQVAEGKTARNSKTVKRKVTKVRGGKGAATRTMGLLGAILAYAVRHGMRPDNPVRGIARFADGRRERRLSDDEYRALGQGLKKAATVSLWPPAIAAARFLAITGWRRGEVLGLRWDEVDLVKRIAVLSDTKTGRSVRPLSRAACDALRDLGVSVGIVFSALNGDGSISGFQRHWADIAKLGGLPPDVTPHTLRHSFASLAGDLGYSEPTIAALIGHQGRTVTSRYMHSADAVLLAAADKVANRTADLMDGADTGVILAFAPVRVAD